MVKESKEIKESKESIILPYVQQFYEKEKLSTYYYEDDKCKKIIKVNIDFNICQKPSNSLFSYFKETCEIINDKKTGQVEHWTYYFDSKCQKKN